MTAKRAISAALGLAAMVISLQAIAQTNPYAALKQYDYQDRRAAMEIRREIQAAGPDGAKQAPIEAGLISVIQDPASTLAGRQEAARLLWMVAGAKSAPVLAKLLPDPAMNNLARYGLERDPDPSAAAALRSALSTAKGEPLVGVINSVGNRADAAAVPALRKLAASPDPLVSDAAITALGKVGTTAAVSALRSLPSKSLGVYNALLRSAAKLTASPSSRAEGMQLYESLAAQSSPSVIRAGALQGLVANHAPNVVPLALSIASTATDLTLQREAARILGGLPQSEQWRVANAYPKLPSAAQIALLAAWANRREAIGLGHVIVDAQQSTLPEKRAAAIRALARIGGVPAVPVLAGIAAGGDQAQVAREALARMNGGGVGAALARLLTSGTPEVRVVVANILAERPGPASESALIGAAAGSDSRVASAALKALGRMGAKGQEPRMVQILVDTKQDEVRDAAQSAIVAVAQKMGDRDRAAEPLLSAYGSASTAGKASLVAALAEVGGDRAFDVISRAASSQDAELRGAALNALANTWSDSRAMPILLKLSKDGASRSDRIVALRGYIRLVGADDLEPSSSRLAHLRDAMALADRPEEKRQALGVLREIRTPAAVEMAAASLDDPQLVAEAADAILYLAARQRKNNRDLQPVTGPEVRAALDKVISTVKDDSVRSRAEKLRQG